MFVFRYIYLIAAIATIECLDRRKLSQRPQPQKGFKLEHFIGNWYYQAKLPPCSWSGSAMVSNYVSQYSLLSDNKLLLNNTFRKGFCTSVPMRLEPCDEPGAFKLRDSIGDLASGDSIVVATDYTCFAVKWGCTKIAVDGSCGDPYVNVKTRDKNPSPQTWKKVEGVLNDLFGLSLKEMVRYTNDAPCVVF